MSDLSYNWHAYPALRVKIKLLTDQELYHQTGCKAPIVNSTRNFFQKKLLSKMIMDASFDNLSLSMEQMGVEKPKTIWKSGILPQMRELPPAQLVSAPRVIWSSAAAPQVIRSPKKAPRVIWSSAAAPQVIRSPKKAPTEEFATLSPVPTTPIAPSSPVPINNNNVTVMGKFYFISYLIKIIFPRSLFPAYLPSKVKSRSSWMSR